MPVPFGILYAKALTFVGNYDRATARRIGLDQALEYADVILDEGPTPEELDEIERMLAEEREAEEKAIDEDTEIPF